MTNTARAELEKRANESYRVWARQPSEPTFLTYAYDLNRLMAFDIFGTPEPPPLNAAHRERTR